MYISSTATNPFFQGFSYCFKVKKLSNLLFSNRKDIVARTSKIEYKCTCVPYYIPNIFTQRMEVTTLGSAIPKLALTLLFQCVAMKSPIGKTVRHWTDNVASESFLTSSNTNGETYKALSLYSKDILSVINLKD